MAQETCPIADSTTTAPEADGAAALFVDLDGTLIVGDTLCESLVLLARMRPLLLLCLPWWLRQGRAALKDQVARRVLPAVDTLPYRTEVLEFLREQKAQGRRLVLATATNIRIAQDVAAHLGIFDAVIASDAGANLRGERKLQAIRNQCGSAPFDYAGDSKMDLPLWRAARHAYVVTGRPGILKNARAVCSPKRVFDSPPAGMAFFKAMRPVQWVKNLLLLAPLFLAHQYGDHHKLLAALLAFMAMSLCASAIYLVNDLCDLTADRAHPRKKFRPLAAGLLSIPTAITMAGGLLALGVAMAMFMVNGRFAGLLLLYLLFTTCYSLYFKQMLLLDVFILAGLYTLRLIAGGIAVGVPLSFWLLAFAMFLFVSLAFVKRYAELSLMKDADIPAARGRCYHTTDSQMLAGLGTASGYLAVMIFALYINSAQVSALYQQPQILWLICPILLYWISRIWFLAHRRAMEDDPVIFAVRDRVSWICILTALLLILLAVPKLKSDASQPLSSVATPLWDEHPAWADQAQNLLQNPICQPHPGPDPCRAM